MKLEFIPGWLLLLVIALASSYSSELVVLGGKHPLEASAVAVVLGMLIRNLASVPARCKSGVSASEKLLILGIVLMGAGLNFNDLSAQGPRMLLIVIVTMVLGFFLIYFSAKAFSLPQGLSLLLAVGTTICGTSAIAITAPLIKAKEEETSYAVGTVALWGLVAILLYPFLGRAIGATDLEFGVFAGTAIHSTPQVVGAGYIFSDIAGQTATAVKLVRNCFMAPLAIAIALWYAKRVDGVKSEKVNIAKAFPWFLFGYFLLAYFSSQGFFTKTGVDAFSSTGKFLILLGMAGIGLNTSFKAFSQVGLKPLIVGLIGSIVLALISGAMIWGML